MSVLDRLGQAARHITAVRVFAAVLTVSAAGTATIITHEGIEERVYRDPVGIPTSCVGHTKTVTEADVGKPVPRAVCERLLLEDLKDAEGAVKRHVKVPITQEQYDALVSFTFNVGEGNLKKSTLLKRINAGQCMAAAREFGKWVYARGKKLAGLVKRRADEAELYATGCKENE
jgi:lysozyme